MRDYFVIAGMSAPGGDKGKKPRKDPPLLEDTWEDGESSLCPERCRVSPPPADHTLPPKKRKFNKNIVRKELV
jgi:hypothetical protein